MRWLAIAAGVGFAVVLLAILVVLRRGHSTAEAPEDAASQAPATATAPAEPPALATIPAAVADGSAPEASPSDLEAPTVKPAPPKAKRRANPDENASKALAPEVKPAIVAEPAPRNVAAPQPVIDTVRTDPLQVLNNALARCAREDMLSRPSCEQSARSQFCSNWWGQIPQCPIGPATDHGQ